jgi:hypothetical protein
MTNDQHPAESSALTPGRLAEIEARAGKATEGPWLVGSAFGEDGLLPHEVVISPKQPTVDLPATPQGRRDAQFIAHAREDIPDLLAELEWKHSQLMTVGQIAKLNKRSAESWAREVERVTRDLAEARAELAALTAVAESNQRECGFDDDDGEDESEN